MTGPILVVNPNSDEAVTGGLRAALAPFAGMGAAIECLTLAGAPRAIETQADIEAVVQPLGRLVTTRADASAFVIACYSDPGVDLCRSLTGRPVYGIQEAGVLSALARGDRVGVIALSERSIARHLRALRRIGVLDRLAGEEAAALSVGASGDAGAFAALAAAGERLVARGADVIVLGCAGMARQRGPLEAALARPVIDPTQAAVAMALGAVLAAG